MAVSVQAPPSAPRLLTIRRAAVTLLFLAAVLGGALFGVLFAYESDLPQVASLEDFQPNIITQVFAADGSLLGEFAIETLLDRLPGARLTPTNAYRYAPSLFVRRLEALHLAWTPA